MFLKELMALICNYIPEYLTNEMTSDPTKVNNVINAYIHIDSLFDYFPLFASFSFVICCTITSVISDKITTNKIVLLA